MLFIIENMVIQVVAFFDVGNLFIWKNIAHSANIAAWLLGAGVARVLKRLGLPEASARLISQHLLHLEKARAVLIRALRNRDEEIVIIVIFVSASVR